MQPDSDCSTDTLIDEKNGSSTDWTPSIIEDSDCEGRSSSSTFSWTDEAGSSVAEQLKQRYELFEAALYSEVPSELLTSSERAEKEIWDEFTPHLRVVGKKVKLVEGSRSHEDSPSTFHGEIIDQHPKVPRAQNEEIKLISSRTDKVKNYLLAPSRNEMNKTREEMRLLEKGVQAFDDKALELACLLKTNILPISKGNLPKRQLRPLSPFSLTPLDELDNVSTKENNETIPPLNESQSMKIAQLDISFTPLNLQVRSPRAKRRIKTSYCLSTGKHGSRPLRPDSRKLLSARLVHKKCLKTEHETESASENLRDSPDYTERQNFLPPIETLTITSQLSNKRASSAMLQFSKVKLRSRPTTSRSKSLVGAAGESFTVIESSRKLPCGPIDEYSGNFSGASLPFNSSNRTNKHLHTPPRWRY